MQGALALAAQGAELAKVKQTIRLRHGTCSTWQLPAVPDVVVTNPPWGRRLLNSVEVRPRQRQQQQRRWQGTQSDHNHERQARLEPGYDSGRDELAEAWLDLKAFLREPCAGESDPSLVLKVCLHRASPCVLDGCACVLNVVKVPLGGLHLISYIWRHSSGQQQQGCRAGSTAYVLCGNAEATRHLSMRASRKMPLTLSSIDVRLLKYEIRSA